MCMDLMKAIGFELTSLIYLSDTGAPWDQQK